MENTSLLKNYPRRPGAEDLGRDYEYKVTALLSLRCAALQDTKDMWIGSNVDHVGDFDDVVLCRETHDGKILVFLIQLKHQEVPRNIHRREFTHTEKNKPSGVKKKFKEYFSLFKYAAGFEMLKCRLDNPNGDESEIIGRLRKINDMMFILYTNRGVNDCDLLERVDTEFIQFLDTSSNNENVAYKFKSNNIDVDPEFLKRLILLPNQAHLNALDDLIGKEIKRLFGLSKSFEMDLAEASDKYVSFIKRWTKGIVSTNGKTKRTIYTTLTKVNIVNKITDISLDSYKFDFSRDIFEMYDSARERIWNTVVLDKTVTVVSADRSNLNFLKCYVGSEVAHYIKKSKKTWADHVSKKDLDDLSITDQLTTFDVYAHLWFNGKLPLLLCLENIENLQNVVKILQLSEHRLRVIVALSERFDQTFKLRGAKKCFLHLNHLNNDHREIVLSQEGYLQGRRVKIMEVINDSMLDLIKAADVIDILTGTFHIGKQAKPLPDCFVEQSLLQTVIDPGILLQNTNEIILLEKHVRLRPRDYKYETLKNLDDINSKSGIFIIDEHASINFNKLALSTKQIHHLKIYDENYLEWKGSYGQGNVEALKRFEIILEHKLTNEIVDKFPDSVIIISAIPGMGKSILIDWIALRAPTEWWVLKIDLNKHLKYFKHKNCEVSETDAELHFQYFCGINNELEKVVFREFVNGKKVLALFDGFDEVPAVYRIEVINVVKSLKKGGCTILITTRPVTNSYLEKTLDVKSITIKHFTVDDQKQFLVKYFKLHAPKRENPEAFADRLLRAAKKNLNYRDVEFTGIPLQIHLLADAFVDSFSEKFDLLFLYQHFIDNKIKIYLDKYGHVANDLHVMIQDHQELFALKLLFTTDNFSERIMEKLYDSYRKDTKRLQLLQREGIIMVDEEFNVSCVHRTFAEYLAARWLSENMDNGDEEIREFARGLINERFIDDYKFLFNIFDRILAKDCPLHLEVIHDTFNEPFTNDDYNIEAIDKGGRMATHLMAIYGKQYPVPYSLYDTIGFTNDLMLFCIKTVSVEKSWIDRKDDMGYTPLDYALANRSLAIADELLKHLGEVSINSYIKLDYGLDYLQYCKNRYPQLFRLLLPYFSSRDLLMGKVAKNTTFKCYTRIGKHWSLCGEDDDYKGKTVFDLLLSNYLSYEKRYLFTNYYKDLRFAIVLGTVSNVRELLLQGTDVNKQDMDKNSPLHYAIIHNRHAIVQLLLNFGANVNKENKEMNTPLHLAASHGSSKEIARVLIFRGAKVNVTNKNGDTPLHLVKRASIAKTLISNGAHVNKPNAKGRNAIFNAVETDNSHVVKLLLQNNAEANLKDISGDTPIHLALRQSFNKIAIILLHHADLQMEDKNGNTPLHLVLMRKNKDLATTLISRGVSVTATNENNDTPLHLALNTFWLDVVELLVDKLNINVVNKESLTPLFIAVNIKWTAAVRLLLDKGADVNIKNKIGNVPISSALLSNNFDIVNLLINTEMEINSRNNTGSTPLHIAAMQGFADFSQKLIEKGAEINAQNKNGFTPLHLALIENRSEVVQLLLREGACVGIASNEEYLPLHIGSLKNYFVGQLINRGSEIDSMDKNGNTALHLLVFEGFIDTAVSVLTEGASVNIQNNDGNIPLHLSLMERHIDFSKLLINKGSDVNVQNNKGNTPLHLAVILGHMKLIEQLIDLGADVNAINKQGNAAIHLALINRHIECINLFINIDAKLDHFNDEGNSPLHLALIDGRIDTATSLLNKGVLIDVANLEGDTPLHLASKLNDGLQVVQTLVGKGATVNAKRINDRIPLHLSLLYDVLNITLFLLDSGSDFEHKDVYGNTSLHLALGTNRTNVIRLLVDRGANVMSTNLNGYTSLHFAASNGNMEIVELLLSKDVDVNFKNRTGETPLHLAAMSGTRNGELVKLLIANGADIDTKTEDNETALDYAKISGCLEAVYAIDEDFKLENN